MEASNPLPSTTRSDYDAFWNDPGRVEEFAARAPDLRLVELAAAYPEPRSVRVLDLGCAGGRNTRFLAERGFDVHAIDSAEAMVAKTRARIAELLGAAEAERRVRLGRMDDLGWAASASFDLVVALGIFQEAEDEAEWERSLAETARVLAPGGRLLVAAFTPRTALDGRTLEHVPETRFVYRGHRSGGTMCLVEAPELDVELARFGFRTEVPTETVVRAAGTGQRVTANGRYVKDA